MGGSARLWPITGPALVSVVGGIAKRRWRSALPQALPRATVKHLLGPLSAPALVGNGRTPQGVRAFAEFDDALAANVGLLVARVASEAARSAVLAHTARRAAGAGLRTLHIAAGSGGSVWAELAARLHVDIAERDPAGFAARLAAALRAHALIATAPLPPSGTWDRAVAHEISEIGVGPALVLVALAGAAIDGFEAATFDLTAALDEASKGRFFEALTKSAHRSVAHDDLAKLDAWWEARSVPRADDTSERDSDIGSAAGAGVAALSLAGRAWPLDRLGALPVTLGEAITHGAAQADAGWVYVAPRWVVRAEQLALASSAQTRCAVAVALQACFPLDAHASIRAAELLLAGEAPEQADAAYGDALAHGRDVVIRQELTARWGSALESAQPDTRTKLQASAAERALEAGEADRAFRWARAAAAHRPDDLALTLLVGRAAVATGDLVSATAALEEGASRAIAPEQRALFAVELAELAYARGDHARAARESELALATAKAHGTRQSARNTLGKLLLATSSWAAAEAHFAEDALTASRAGDRAGELRARVNRGIALLSRGFHDEARSMFDAVLCEGDAVGDARACAFALDNLAVLAMWRHEYGVALAHLERSLGMRLRLGDRLTTARVLANLAELRRKLGLIDHAEHAVAFGRRQLTAGMPSEVSAHFSAVAARLALARGNTALAQREVARAIADGSDANQAQYLAQYLGGDHRVGARVALEEGDLARVEDLLERARGFSTTLEGRAEVAVLDALLARASGRPTAALFSHAVALARAADEEELLREALMLAYEYQIATGSEAAAASTLAQAIAVRDAVAASVSGDVKAAYLRRPEIAALDKVVPLVAAQPAVAVADDGGAPARSSRTLPPGRTRELVGDDPAIRGLLLAVKRVARTRSTVLIRGESGTGKELVACALHRASDRAAGPLVTVNCAALVETLLLSELFGHEKGAFTGAVARRRGRFELAEGGTLFLDEIGDISARTQVALLRVLQERTFERVGGTASLRADVRIVCATHRDLRAMVDRGEFREDLYYRLKGITLEVPPLRNRLGDLARIADDLLARIAEERGEPSKSLTEGALDLLQRHGWPGNVRELDNVLRAVSLFAEGQRLCAGDFATNIDELRLLDVAGGARARAGSVMPQSGELPSESESDDLDDGADAPLPTAEAGPTAAAYACVRQGTVSLADLKRQIERDCIARALADTRGNITRAASLLGMKRPRLSQLVKQYGLAAVSSEPQ